MKTKKNLLKILLSYITYRHKKDTQFTIPEVIETYGTSEQQDKNSMTKENTNYKNDNTKEIITSLKKPISAKEQNHKKEEKSSKNTNIVFPEISKNIDFIKNRFNYPDNEDIVIREFTILKKHKAFIAYLEGMADRATINNFILRPLLKYRFEIHKNQEYLPENILESIIETNRTKKTYTLDDVVNEMLIGNTCLFIDGYDYFISNETKGYEKRNVEKPISESVVKGSQEGFNENLRTNITLIRKIIKNSNLTTEFLKVGERNNNQCAIVYLKGLVNPSIVKEVKRRISSIKTDYISGSGMLEQFIEENPWSIVPTTLSTERPDRVASHIVEGKVAIISDGTPFVIIVPISIFTLFHSPEDTSMRWQYGTMMRFIRIAAFFFATLLPGLYVALTNFHQEMIPTDLLIAIAKARENVPFPTVLEVIFMELSFEIIREAGIRIPGIIGNTIGIIGGLILGQAAVQANLVSTVLIIVIAITGLGNFSIPDFSLAFGARIIRLLFIILGGFIGFYGISLGVVAMAVLLSNMKSFGVDMFAPIAPKRSKSSDLFIRQPIWKQENRPDYVNSLDSTRQPHISRGWIKNDDANSGGGEEIDQ